jgi:hypothetical protein
LTDVICPEHVKVFYDVEDVYGDGGSSGAPDFSWIGIIQDVPQTFDYSRKECRGLGSIDISALADGLKSPELSIKWVIQRKSGAFDPLTFLDYAKSFPEGIGVEWGAEYGLSYLSMWYKGLLPDSLDVEFSIDSFQIATMKLIGREVIDGVAFVGSGYQDNPLDVANGYSLPLTGHDAEVFMNAAGASDESLTDVKRVKFSLKNNLTRVPVIRENISNLLKYILRTKRELSGEITCFMENKDKYADLLNSTLLDIRIDLQKTDNTPYFDFTNVKLDKGSITTRINEVPCEVTLPFIASSLGTG